MIAAPHDAVEEIREPSAVLGSRRRLPSSKAANGDRFVGIAMQS
jgi:hypothetical protein